MKHFIQRLAAADPLRVDLNAIPDQAGQALAQEILMQVSNPKNKDEATQGRATRRRLGYIVALVAAGAIVVPGVAVAGVAVYHGMHSGVYGNGGEAVAGQEFYYTDSPEIVAVVKGLTTEFPLPAGASYDRLLSRYPTAERTLVQRTALGQEVQMSAACAWYQDWLVGDAEQRAADQHTIDAIPTWRYWVLPRNTAPAPSGAPKPIGSQPAESDGSQTVFDRIAQETRSGKDATLKQYLTANCR